MAGFGHYATLGGGASHALLGEGDLHVRTGPEGARLHAVTSEGGTLSTFEIRADGSLRHLGERELGDEVHVGVAPEIVEFDAGGGPLLSTAGLGLGTGGGHALDGGGRPGAGNGSLLGLPDDLGGVATLETADGAFAYGLRPGEDGIFSFRLDAGGQATQIGANALARGDVVSTLATAEVGGQAFVLAGSLDGDAVVAHRVTATGALEQAARVGAPNGLGLSDPSALAVAEVDGATYVVAAGSGSGSLSVMELMPSGSLRVVDHVIDDLDTRFADATAIETITVGERTWVAVTGSDDGLSLLALLPGGRLMAVDDVADTNSAGLQNVTALAVWAEGGEAVLWTLSGSEAGLTRIDLDLGTPGLARGGTDHADVLDGGAADDALAGAAGDDVLRGQAGDDVLIDGAGRDTMWGGAGADTFVLHSDGEVDDIRDFDASEDALDLSAFLFLYDAAQLTLLERSWGVEVRFRDETVRLFAEEGGTLTAADVAALDLIPLDRPPVGGVAAAVAGDGADEWLQGGFGDDVLSGMGGDDTLVGGVGSDVLAGGDGDDRLHGAFDDDVMRGGAGADSLYGGTGTDVLDGDAGDDLLRGDAGDDTLRGGDGDDTLVGQDGSERLEGGRGRDDLAGGAGDDRLYGDGGRDVVRGGDGNDRVAGGGSHDLVEGGDGRDKVYGGGGRDTMSGGAGDDVVRGGNGSDAMEGGEGDDGLYGGRSSDTIHGGAGADSLDGEDGSDLLRGGDGDDDLVGGRSGDILHGDAGADRLWGGDQRDTLDGGAGDDRLWGEQGNDVLDGGWGHDAAWGGDGADSLTGGAGNDALDGGRHADTLRGGAGDDTVDGGDHDDWLYGDEGDDALVGGWGNDVLVGGRGDDRLDGGGGVDSYRIADGDGADTIEGFDPSLDGEVIDLSRISAISGWSDLEANHMADTADGVLIDLGAGGSLLVAGLRKTDLSAADFEL
ncbi:hypothetical protein JQC91_04760 [Jannaschia sp. Os4]|uniref:calcium-binding protein n=1 Tax=Jannaschia sp. Os4 TaxID=2807617 RepID=UPI00193ABDDF|nr:hypothetical protein [Jannaschia sp. Os4]MBM2575609.1 hypothetical protein [Jannaschia sp. Os4]